MVEPGLRGVARVVACVGEGMGEDRDMLVAALSRSGVTDVHVDGDLESLVKAAAGADILVLSDSLGPGLWNAVADIRHSRIGDNPFVTIICVIGAANQMAAREAIASGADDVVARPLNEEQLVQRLRRAMVQRAPFVVSSDYIGPERRARDRGLAIGRIVVPNTFLERASGRARDPATLNAMIALGITDLMRARLDAHGYRLGWLAEMRDPDLLPLARSILADAATLATKVKEPALALVCGSVNAALGQGAPLAELDSAWGAIAIVGPCLRFGIPPEIAATDASHAAMTYRQRSRSPFRPIREIGVASSGADAVFPPLEIRLAKKGERLFEQGEPATTGYLIVTGSVSLFRRRQDTDVPLAKLRRGEVVGEIAAMDGSPRRVTAVVAEDAILCVLRSDDLSRSLEGADPIVGSFLQMLRASARGVHETYTPKSRHISDSIQQMVEQVAAIADYIGSPSAPKGLEADASAIATRLGDLTTELIGLIASHPELDRRMRALPDAGERDAGGRPDAL